MSSPLAESLVSDGASATEVDAQEMLRQLQQQVATQQALIEKLAGERGVPVNPVAVFVQTLTDHLTAQSNANPLYSADYEIPLKFVKGFNVESVSVDDAQFLRELVDDLIELHPQHELAYVRTVARDLYRHLLRPEG